MKTKTISFVLALSALVYLANARAITIAEYTGGTEITDNLFFGQSFTTDPGSPTSNIAFNFFLAPGTTTPYAAGEGFLLGMEYLGTPAGLSSSTPGFLGQATASGGFYTFDPSLTLLPNTQYFLYENARLPDASAGGIYPGGHLYFSGDAGLNFQSFPESINFRVTGTPVVPSVPESGSTVMLLGIGFVVLAFFTLEGGTLAWPNGADIAPERLYEMTEL